MTVLIMNALGCSPRIRIIRLATASPAPHSLIPEEIALKAPTRIRQFQSIALTASFTLIQPEPTITRAPTTAAICIGTFLEPEAITASTQNMVRPQITAFFLSNSFFSVWANSGTYPVSGSILLPTKAKKSVPMMQIPIPKGVIEKKPNGSYPSSCITPAADAFEPTPTRVTNPPNWEPNNSASSAFDGP